MSVETYAWQRSIYQRTTAQSGASTERSSGREASRTDSARREELILRYAPLVKYVAGRLRVFLPPVLSMDDLLSHGTIGLIEAIDRYDSCHGVKFETYAIRRIWGSMIDALRSLSLLPRSTVQQVKALDTAVASLEHELGRSPTPEEMAKRLGCDEAEIHNLLVAANLNMLSLETKVGSEDGGLTLVDTLVGDSEDPVVCLEREELLAHLAQAIECLPDRERLVLSLYYHEELTLKEIGKVLQVSESRVSQLHAVALTRLRVALAPSRAEFRSSA